MKWQRATRPLPRLCDSNRKKGENDSEFLALRKTHRPPPLSPGGTQGTTLTERSTGHWPVETTLWQAEVWKNWSSWQIENQENVT